MTDAPAEVEAARGAAMSTVRIDRARDPRAAVRDASGNEWWGSLEELEG